MFVQAEMEHGVGVKRAAIRKLEHELGIPTTTFAPSDLRYITSVMYKAASDANWTEYELDHILLARGDVELSVNANEVERIEFLSLEDLPAFVADQRHQISPWFRLIAQDLLPKWWRNLDELLAAPSDAPPKIHDYRD